MAEDGIICWHSNHIYFHEAPFSVFHTLQPDKNEDFSFACAFFNFFLSPNFADYIILENENR